MPRPKKDQKYPSFTLTLPPDVYEKIVKRCEATGQDRSSVIREYVKKGMATSDTDPVLGIMEKLDEMSREIRNSTDAQKTTLEAFTQFQNSLIASSSLTISDMGDLAADEQKIDPSLYHEPLNSFFNGDSTAIEEQEQDTDVQDGELSPYATHDELRALGLRYVAYREAYRATHGGSASATLKIHTEEFSEYLGRRISLKDCTQWVNEKYGREVAREKHDLICKCLDHFEPLVEHMVSEND